MERRVFFNSDGIRIAGILFEPEATDNDSCPAIMLCQGMVGVKEYFWFPHLARRLVELGCVALIWDYRGVGESEGEPGRLYPLEQVEDQVKAAQRPAEQIGDQENIAQRSVELIEHGVQIA